MSYKIYLQIHILAYYRTHIFIDSLQTGIDKPLSNLNSI